MSEDNIRWSSRRWTLGDFPEDLQLRLRQLKRNRPLFTEQVNGDEMYVRRVGTNRFQCGVFGLLGNPSNPNN
jgi:hypothetical protein